MSRLTDRLTGLIAHWECEADYWRKHAGSAISDDTGIALQRTNNQMALIYEGVIRSVRGAMDRESRESM